MSIERAITRISETIGDRLKTSNAIRKEHAKSEAHYPEHLPDAVASWRERVRVRRRLELAPAVSLSHGSRWGFL